MTLEDLKKYEAILLKNLYDYKNKLWESPLSQEEKQDIETRFNLLKNATESTFQERYKLNKTIGNV